MKNKNFLSAFTLKIIAIIAMTFDHIGTAILAFFGSSSRSQNIYDAFKIVGRLALPLFLFLIIEGFKHTTNIKKYFLRLGISLGAIWIITNILTYAIQGSGYIFNQLGNIFVDLILFLLILFLFNKKEWYFKLLALLPILYFVITLLLQCEIIPSNSVIKAITNGLMPQYPLQTAFVAIFYILTTLFYKAVNAKQLANMEIDDALKLDLELRELKICYSITLILLSLFMYALTYAPTPNYINAVGSTYFAIAVVPIIFYNGKLGFHTKYSKYAFYLYYPLHIGIICLICYLITL